MHRPATMRRATHASPLAIGRIWGEGEHASLYKRINRRLLCRRSPRLPLCHAQPCGQCMPESLSNSIDQYADRHATVGSRRDLRRRCDEPGGCHEHNEACALAGVGVVGASTLTRAALGGWEPNERSGPGNQDSRTEFPEIPSQYRRMERLTTGMRWSEGPIWFGDGVICFGATRRTTASCVGTRRLERRCFRSRQ